MTEDLHGEEDKWLFFYGAVLFSGGKMKVGGLNLRMTGVFCLGNQQLPSHLILLSLFLPLELHIMNLELNFGSHS